MAEVVIYTKTYCLFSQKCKEFLKNKGVEYNEKVIDNDKDSMEEMLSKSGERKDTPQVFVNGHHVGSFDDLKALEATGDLDKLLN